MHLNESSIRPLALAPGELVATKRGPITTAAVRCIWHDARASKRDQAGAWRARTTVPAVDVQGIDRGAEPPGGLLKEARSADTGTQSPGRAERAAALQARACPLGPGACSVAPSAAVAACSERDA